MNAADAQRVRMALPYLAEFGWDAHILAVRPEDVEAVRDPLLLKTIPADIPVTRVSTVPVSWSRRVGIGSLALRSLWPLWRAGNRLLRMPFDLLFFSTTQFPVTLLGPLWRQQFQVPYLVDFQDPWWSTYQPAEPPGGRRKYAWSQRVAAFLEPTVVRGAGHIIAVSEAYPAELHARYANVPESRFTVLPFGAPGRDFEILEQTALRQHLFDPKDGRVHWVYVGRGGKDMHTALRGIFQTLAKYRHQDSLRWGKIKMHFFGTDYAPERSARKTIEPLAQECGVGDLVEERAGRIPYFEALACLLDAQALIVPGSDDPQYTASKIYPYILARKPMLAVFHEQSSVVPLLRSTHAGTVVTFSKQSTSAALADEIGTAWFAAPPTEAPEVDWTAFAPHSAREMTRRLCATFQKAIAHG